MLQARSLLKINLRYSVDEKTNSMEKRKSLSKIRKEFPELKWKKAEHNIQGWDHYVIILDNKYVFRFPRTKHYLERLENEISLLEYLKEKVKISIPQYTHVAKDKSFAGYKLIPGYQLKKKIFKFVSDKTRHILAKQISDFLSTLHKTPMKVATKYSTKKVDTQKMYKELVLKTNKWVMPRLSKRNQLVVNDFFKEFKNYLKFPNNVFTHNDLYSSHILLSKNKKYISGIIDFADRRMDDPARDFTELWDYGNDFIQEVYKNYKGPKDKDFLMRSMMYYKRIPFYEMISRFQGERGSFKTGFKMFKYRFLSKSIFN